MPVAIAPINRQRHQRRQRGNQIAALLIDRAAPIEMVVVFRHGEHAFAGNIAAAQNIFKEGNYVVTALRPAEGYKQQSVVHKPSLQSWLCGEAVPPAVLLVLIQFLVHLLTSLLQILIDHIADLFGIRLGLLRDLMRFPPRTLLIARRATE